MLLVDGRQLAEPVREDSLGRHRLGDDAMVPRLAQETDRSGRAGKMKHLRPPVESPGSNGCGNSLFLGMFLVGDVRREGRAGGVRILPQRTDFLGPNPNGFLFSEHAYNIWRL